MSGSPSHKRLKSTKDAEPYTLIYWPGMPGRGEHARLLLEEAGAEYTDVAQKPGGVKEVLALIDPESTGDDVNCPVCAPPILKHGDLIINQTPNIVLYLAKRLGLAGDEEADPDVMYRLNALVLTALDGLSNEAHDTHHPIANSQYYEDQKEEALKKAKDYTTNRLPKFLGFFERVISSKPAQGGPWLYGGQLTYADLVLFQVSSHNRMVCRLSDWILTFHFTSAWMASGLPFPRPWPGWRSLANTTKCLPCTRLSRSGQKLRNTWPVSEG